jgi:hypothetical protein
MFYAQQSRKNFLALEFPCLSKLGKRSSAFELDSVKGEKITTCHHAFLYTIGPEPVPRNDAEVLACFNLAIVPEASARRVSLLGKASGA